MEKVLKLGMHIEMIKAGLELDALENVDKKFISSLHEIVDDSTLVISNPTIKTRLIPLHSGERYDGYFFQGRKIYTARFVVDKPFTDGNFRVVRIRLLNDLEKYERRQFYRLETTMDIRYLILTPDNTEEFKKAVQEHRLALLEGFQPGTTLDISGGGMRFSSSEEIPKDSMLIVQMNVRIEDENRSYTFPAKRLSSERQRENRNLYIHRIQFVDFKHDVREELVKYIFKRQRDRLKKQNS